MKKFVAMLMALLMLTMMSISALAEDIPEVPAGAEETLADVPATRTAGSPSPSITKTYTTSGTATNVFPTETLTFTVTPQANTYPEVTVGYDGTEEGKTKNTYNVSGVASTDIPVNVPAAADYGVAGRYHYVVTEGNGTSQAVSYNSPSTTFNVDVYVFYTKNNNNELVLDKQVVVYSGTEISDDPSTTAKADTFKNTYSVGALKVTKTIAGNLADPKKEFNIKVTLTAGDGKTVASDITIDATNATSVKDNITKIDKGWTGSKVIEFTAKGGQYIEINNIPTGVTYTIEETDITRITNAAGQITNANDANAYAVSGEVTSATAIGTTTASETITNTKEITIPTGITLETVPYVLIMALVLFGMANLAARKREDY